MFVYGFIFIHGNKFIWIHKNANMYEICCCFFVAVVQDGESNWLEGVMLMAAYLIISVVFW